MMYFQGREVCLGDFIKDMFNIALLSGACELLSLKLGMMTDMSKVYIFVPVLMTLTFI